MSESSDSDGSSSDDEREVKDGDLSRMLMSVSTSRMKL